MTTHKDRASAGLIVVLLLSLLTPVGCGGAPRRTTDPLTTLRDPAKPAITRLRAAEALPEAILAGEVPLGPGREALIDLAWLRRVPSDLRVAGVRGVFSLTDEESERASIDMVQSMLPTETDMLVVEHLAFEAANRGWVECTGAIVRSYSTVNTQVPDDERPELVALRKLHPSERVPATVFDVFLKPEGPWGDSNQRVSADGLERRVRRDAWDLLARIDRDGQIRVRLLSGLVASDTVSDDKDLDALRAGLRDAAVIPLTGEELEWLVAMRAHESGRWWRQVVEGVRSLSPQQRRGLRIRHLASVRWASLNEAGWLTLTTPELIERLSDRLSSREAKLPGFGIRIAKSEDLADWVDELSWGELLTIRVIDEAVHDPRVLAGLAGYIVADREDRTTEYGGLIFETGTRADTGSRFASKLYRPRPITRLGDSRFVASREMIEDSTAALAHFHLHAQRADNGRYAGPSRGDLDYAERYGRGCLVATTLSETRINVDYYNPDGVVVDLGSFDLPAPAASADAR